ncbi:hypothetical protein C4J81_06445 [Deltaproteobacteria bacterium Smac51]|nr:hypothetical protein C4J81_06445 [Deltaproteobacteria bacterium Smac51]
MNDLHVFYSEDFGQIRGFLDEDGNPWFVASDVCAALGILNSRDAVNGLDDDEKITVANTDGNPRAGIPHQFSAISEPGLYSLIFRSRKPEAKAFKRWVTHEVIPTIRKTGQYQQATVQALAIVRQPCEYLDLVRYISVLRQMARLKVYPPQMRAGFLAEAASLLSGYPVSRFMPPDSYCPLFQ